MGTSLSEPGKIITFYSYKGGTGRSMAVANVSCLLAKRRKNPMQKVLVIDWDLEAPGLHRYFWDHSIHLKISNSPGLLNYFCDLKEILDKKPDLYKKIEDQGGFKVLDNAIPLERYIIPEIVNGIDFIKAGNYDSQYPTLVNTFDLAEFFEKYSMVFDAFKELISLKYAFCLIDSRTGFTDTSGICTMIMPEKLVTVFTPNIQSLYGLTDLIKQAIGYRIASDDFRPFTVLPLASRIDSEEQDLKDEWRHKYQREFENLFIDIYELVKCDLSSYFDQIQLPQIGYYSYGEKIAVLGTHRKDVYSLSNAYMRFLNYLIDFDFAWQEFGQSEDIEQHLLTVEESLLQKNEPRLKVYLSSTFYDLMEYRRAAIDVLLRFQCIPMAMEYFNNRTKDAETVCDQEVEACDLFIGIYAHRYGYVPDGRDKSITQMEYELAGSLAKPRLCFIAQKGTPWDPDVIDFENKAAREQFLEVVKTDQTVDFYTDPDNLAIKIATALSHYIAGRQKGVTGKTDPQVPDGIPHAPMPYIVHPYALRADFTGRRKEIAVLSHWFYNQSQPVLVINAIGGMGKSALSWVWLQKEILPRTVEVAGVFWWSFYDAPFDSFIQSLARYVLGVDRAGTVDMEALMVALQHNKFLLVLDGLERALIGYAGMEAMFIQENGFRDKEGHKEAEAQSEQRKRQPVHPLASRFLQALAGCNTRTLITTRLMPAPLEGLAGVSRLELTGLSKEDTVSFLCRAGVTGSPAEMVDAGRVYDFHPLMLSLLAAAVRRSRSRDIEDAFALNLIHRDQPHKILSTSFNLLTQEEKQVAVTLSVFRSVFTAKAAAAIMPDIEENRLWEIMMALRDLGFVFYDEAARHFDFHPIIRAFLYDGLTSRAAKQAHTLAVEYLHTFPEPKKAVTLEDLGPVIELYHHLVKAGKFDKAYEFFSDRIFDLCYYQFAAYHLQIELIRQLFPEGDDGKQLPRLKTEAAQAWMLNALAGAYALSGRPAKAVPLLLLQSKLYEKNQEKTGLAISLGNAAHMAQIQIGQLSASAVHLQKSIVLCREIEDELREAVGRQELGHVSAFRGTGAGSNAEEELDIAFKLFEKSNCVQSLSLVSAYRSLSALLQARLATVLPGEANRVGNHIRGAMEQARRALEFAEKTAKMQYPYLRDFVRAYWLLGEALIQCRVSPGMDTPACQPFDIPFYDEYFQEQTRTVTVSAGNEPEAAERCLHDALRRCRKTNMVEFEPDILLALCRLDWVNGQPPDPTRLQEAQTIAQRAGYRLHLADLHLFCGQVLLEDRSQNTLLGLTAKAHLEQAREYALDVSEFTDLYQSKDPDFYKGIPEYDMLKRGMTPQERIDNGYAIAHRIAEELLKRF